MGNPATGAGGGGGGGAASKAGDTYTDTKRKDDVRMASMEAAKAVADAVRTSLGPRGMDKMVRARARTNERTEDQPPPPSARRGGG